MDPEAVRKARITVLQRKIDIIHYANKLYWRQATPSNAAKADYYWRQGRLEEVRRDLAELQEASIEQPTPAHDNLGLPSELLVGVKRQSRP